MSRSVSPAAVPTATDPQRALVRTGSHAVTAHARTANAAAARRHGHRAGVVRWLLLGGVLVLTVLASLLLGTRAVGWSTTWHVLPHVVTGDVAGVTGVPALDAAVVESRAWRTGAGVLAGAGLAVAGALLQGATRNPLGDPGILGLSAGAAFAVVLGATVLARHSVVDQLWLAAAGSAVAMVVVYGLASAAKGGARPVTLALTGAAVSAGLMALTNAVLLTHQATFNEFRTWQVGDLTRPDGGFVLAAAPVVAVGLVLAWTLASGLDALGLGDALGRGLGASPAIIRGGAGVAVVLLAGTATALVGPLVFCGLLVPHAVRAVFSVSYRVLVPACALAGPTVVLVADTVARLVVPDREVQVGIALVVLGAPALVAIVRRRGAVSA